jgi:hypothetical protein
MGGYRHNAKPEEPDEDDARWGGPRVAVLLVLLLIALIADFRLGRLAGQREERQHPPVDECEDSAFDIHNSVFTHSCPSNTDGTLKDDLMVCKCRRPPSAAPKAPRKELPVECIKAWVLEGPSGTYDEWKDKPKGCER